MTDLTQTPNIGLYKHGQGKPNWQYAHDMETIDSEIGDIDSRVDTVEQEAAQHADDETITGDWSFTGDLDLGTDGVLLGDFTERTLFDLTLDASWGNLMHISRSSGNNMVWGAEGSRVFTIRDAEAGGHVFSVFEGGAVQTNDGENTLATQAWVDANFDEYTDSDARSAVTGGTLSGSVTIDTGNSSTALDLSSADIQGVDDIYFDSGPNPNLYVDSSSVISLGASTVDVSATLQQNGSNVATESWVNSNFNDYTFSESHDDLSNVGDSDHHPRYSDSEAVYAVENEGILNIDISGFANEAGQATQADDSDTVDGWHVEIDESNGIVNFTN